MFYTRDWAQPWAQRYLIIALMFTLANWTQALSITYCSSQNYALGSPTSSNYMSNGLCQDTCKGFTFAVIQGKDCWCSNYAPSDQQDTGKCDSPCPGYPSDLCGNVDQGLYAYYSLGGTPSGTSGGSSPSSRTSSSSVGRSSSSSSLRSSSTSQSTTTSSSSSTSTTPEPTQVYTSVISVTGRVSTIIVTPTPAQTSDSALGTSQQSSGVSGGTVAGIVVGVAIVIGLIIGAAVFFWLRKRHRKSLDALSEGGSYTSPTQTGKSGGGIPSRQVSQMSSAGLLAKPSRSNTAGFSSVDDQRSAKANTLGSDRNSTHMTVDQRLNPWAIYSSEDSRASNVSLQDNQDYSRQLRVANPDP